MSGTGRDVFIGIGPAPAVDQYLAGSAVDKVTDLDVDPFRLRTVPQGGSAPRGSITSVRVFGMIVSVLLSIVYALARKVFGLLVLRGRGEAVKDVELLVLRHEVTVPRRQVSRPRLEPKDRMPFAALSRVLPRPPWRSRIVSAATLLRWHRELVARRWGYPRIQATAGGRPPVAAAIRALVVRLAREKAELGTSSHPR